MKNMVGPMSGVMIARWLDYSLPSDLRGEQGSAQLGDALVRSPNSLLQRAANRVFARPRRMQPCTEFCTNYFSFSNRETHKSLVPPRIERKTFRR